MCLMMDSEVLLANLLTYRDEVTYRDMEAYCERIKSRLIKEAADDVQCVSFDLSSRTLFDNVLRYPTVFRYSAETYYPGEDFRKGYFEKRTPLSLRPILDGAAREAAGM